MLKLIRFFLFICISLFMCGPLIGQEEGNSEIDDTTIVRKVCIYDIQQVQENEKATEAEIFIEVIKNTLVFELKLAGFEIIEDSIWKSHQNKKRYSDNDLLEGANAVNLGQLANADVAINGFFSIEKKRILFGIKCYDVKSRRLAVSILKSGRAGISATSLITNAIEEIIPKISEELANYSASGDTIEKEVIVYEDITFKEMIELGTKIRVTVTSPDEEADIYLADKHIGKIENGELSFDSKASSAMLVKVEKEKHHPKYYEFELGEDDQVINLPPLAKVSRLALETQYTFFQFIGLGIGIRYYFNPDWFFISGTNYFYAQADYLPGSNNVFHNDMNLSIGHYIYFSPDSLFRTGVYVGFGYILTMFPLDEPIYSDFYYDILGGWIELNFKHFLLYFKEAGRFNHNMTGEGLLETGWAKPIPVVLSIGAIWKW